MSKPPETLILERLPTPVGEAILVADAQGVLRAFDWTSHEARLRLLLRRQNPPTTLVEGRAPAVIREAVDAYFAGDLTALAAISWRTGGTDFQRSVWTALCAIPVGETVTYKQLAERIGRPSAVRAVGLANGANPVGVVVPCHRVIGSDGSLTGYGGGLERKRWLLTHEGASFRAAA
ncbi:methylated-DNA--[protein]-cysteine S-methyltransferase [Phenylobacterium sp.]|uniref:methylated-DNA--[protein]-cysteine S-methyltransferase n=1 Tax=Phenylobacterium sp. TaxID=1871053 RepID=UPI00086BB87A|nr:MAG: methylated-DNA--protein-cysteine methyltransferase [Phenylobacterium sp. SCN 69-14]